jgi:branched-chain amino acid transport system ATP-binding protein
MHDESVSAPPDDLHVDNVDLADPPDRCSSAGDFRTHSDALRRPDAEACACYRRVDPPRREETLLHLNEVRVSFGGVRALDGVTVQVPAGGVTALIGPNGAGKTTLLNCLSGFCRYSGTIRLDGASLDQLPPYRRCRAGIGRTFQTPRLVDDLPAVDNVMLGAHSPARGRVRGRGGRTPEVEARKQALRLLSELGISPLADRPAGDLTHADRRRVETARALVTRPRLLLLDEPSAGLADGEALQLLWVAASLSATCLLVEHNMPVVMSAAAQVIVLDTGRVLATDQ